MRGRRRERGKIRSLHVNVNRSGLVEVQIRSGLLARLVAVNAVSALHASRSTSSWRPTVGMDRQAIQQRGDRLAQFQRSIGRSTLLVRWIRR